MYRYVYSEQCIVSHFQLLSFLCNSNPQVFWIENFHGCNIYHWERAWFFSDFFLNFKYVFWNFQNCAITRARELKVTFRYVKAHIQQDSMQLGPTCVDFLWFFLPFSEHHLDRCILRFLFPGFASPFLSNSYVSF